MNVPGMHACCFSSEYPLVRASCASVLPDSLPHHSVFPPDQTRASKSNLSSTRSVILMEMTVSSCIPVCSCLSAGSNPPPPLLLSALGDAEMREQHQVLASELSAMGGVSASKVTDFLKAEQAALDTATEEELGVLRSLGMDEGEDSEMGGER
jgi:hypothetical protein